MQLIEKINLSKIILDFLSKLIDNVSQKTTGHTWHVHPQDEQQSMSRVLRENCKSFRRK